jgi:hypothetical protein
VRGKYSGTWYNHPTYSSVQWDSKIDVPKANGSPSFSYFYADPDGSYIRDFTFEDVYINGNCMKSLSDFPNGGALTIGDVSGFTFICN